MIRVQGLTVRAGAFALENVSFEIPTGCYGMLMGKTGSGKTTLLEALCGLKRVTAGRIELLGRDVTFAKPAERGIGLVPQDGALFTSMTVRENMDFALRIRKWPEEKMRARVAELAGLLDIERLLERKPQGLSGGERQRVALGRALAFGPQVLCLDEPLSALDDETREGMYHLLEQVRTVTGVTALHITHSSREARRLAGCLLRVEGGQVRVTPLAELAAASDAAEARA
ncbi:MAG: ABC transporter ATP-binding protein [Planctomycetes bacterium]|nr:ABC transporter ATP-binding protein [Planctomycetota bacterium]